VIEVRLRNRVAREEIAAREGFIPTADYYAVELVGPARVLQPDGRPLCVFLPGALRDELGQVVDQLSAIRHETRNRGAASGTRRTPAGTEERMLNPRSYARPVMSNVLGSMEATGHYKFCRLTAYTAHDLERWRELGPLWRASAAHFAEHVPERYAAQAREAAATDPAWVIPGTPFSTITINNSWSTGIHVDDGDLDRGFSCLAVARRGAFSGGRLVFPEHRVAVAMNDGDLLLMDAHAYHANTRLVCECGVDMEGPCATCGAERISVVAYYRTRMRSCDRADVERERALAAAERRSGVS
jgi:hypothetical protein